MVIQNRKVDGPYYDCDQRHPVLFVANKRLASLEGVEVQPPDKVDQKTENFYEAWKPVFDCVIGRLFNQGQQQVDQDREVNQPAEFSAQEGLVAGQVRAGFLVFKVAEVLGVVDKPRSKQIVLYSDRTE